MAQVFIGTSGWVYSDWSGKFYSENLPQKKWLEFYSQNFQTVEVNSTFYHQMRPGVFENWAKVVPSGFIFAVKANRFITHIKRLKETGEPLERFLTSILPLGEKLGPILFQLPPRWKADIERLESFLLTASGLQQAAENRKLKAMYAFEFRDQSWLKESIFAILKKNNCALVIQDSPDWPSVETITADFVYLRFHGSQSLYSSNYIAEELKSWAGKIRKWRQAGLDVYAYFNNDVNAYAVENAKKLSDLIKK